VRGGGIAECVGEKAQLGLFLVAPGSILRVVYFGVGLGGGGEGEVVL
jgi:hypothetical protein